MSETEGVKSVDEKDENEERDQGIRGRISRTCSQEESGVARSSVYGKPEEKGNPVNEKREDKRWTDRTDLTRAVFTPETTLATATSTSTTTATAATSGTPSGTENRNTLEDAKLVEVQQRRSSADLNSLPVLVERLRNALEASLSSEDNWLAGASQTGNLEVADDEQRSRNSMEIVDSDNSEFKRDLKYLEDLLLLDIQTALARLRETLERIDVVALAKNGAADPSSKLHLLRLVSSLLSRLRTSSDSNEDKTAPCVPSNSQTTSNAAPVAPAAPTASKSFPNRKKRVVRHTIDVSAEELARARQWLEEQGNATEIAKIPESRVQEKPQERPEPEIARGRLSDNQSKNTNNPMIRRPEEIQDKCVKDAINQQKSLLDKSKDSRLENSVYRDNGHAIRGIFNGANDEDTRHRYCPDNKVQSRYNSNVVACQENNDTSRVSMLAAALRQKADAQSRAGNKFTSKKSKIKRANTIDIPSYLKLQAESLNQDNGSSSGYALRRPIHVGDKSFVNPVNLAVPAFQPKTENDRKFLALINKNNESAIPNPPQAFKTFGYTKQTPVNQSLLTDENWNSRFSNIKTAFDKGTGSDEAMQPHNRLHKRSQVSQMTQRFAPATNSEGFRHAPSSPFRKIEKMPCPQVQSVPPVHRPLRIDNSGCTLREKARQMFDQTGKSEVRKSTVDEKSDKSFPKPPWIDHREDQRTGAENGRIDYRSFCKQFAPFVSKTSEAKQKFDREERSNQQRRNQPRKIPRDTSYDQNSVVDGKLSFKAVSNIGGQYYNAYKQQPESYSSNSHVKQPEHPKSIYHPKHIYEHQQVPIMKKSEYDSYEDPLKKRAFKPVKESNQSMMPIVPKSDYLVDGTLRGSASVAVQTGMDDDLPSEVRSFRVTPRIAKSHPSICANASVQTYDTRVNYSPYIDEHRPTRKEDNVHQDSNRAWESPYTSTSSKSYLYNNDQAYQAVQRDSVRADEQFYPKAPKVGYHSDYSAKSNVDSVPASPQQHVPWNYYPPTALPQNHTPGTNHYDTRETTQNTHYAQPSGPRQSDYHVDSMSNYTKSSNIPERNDYRVDPVSNYVKDTNSNYSIPNYTRDEPAKICNDKPYSYEVDELLDWKRDEVPFTDDENIQNQDISPEVGVVTRYTCAIATVATTDSPDLVSQDGNFVGDSQESLTPSPIKSWSQTKHAANDRLTPEEEIRRHNMLQQSLVRRLQNERVSLNEQKPHSPEITNRLKPISPIQTTIIEPSVANRVTALRDAYEHVPSVQKPVQKECQSNGPNTIDSSDAYLVSCAKKPNRSIVLSKSESWHQLAATNRYPRENRPAPMTLTAYPPKPPKSKSPSSMKSRSKQYEASTNADSVKRMEDKIRRYFDNPSSDGSVEHREHSSRSSRRLSRSKHVSVGLSRSRTMPGIYEQKLSLLLVPTDQTNVSPFDTLDTATDVDKVFDDIFEEATRSNGLHC